MLAQHRQYRGLLDPSLQQEDRRPLKNVVAVVIDRSGSNRIGARERQTTEARAELEKRLGALDNVEAHFVETPRDAVVCFLTTGIDNLVLQDTLVSKTALHRIVGPLVGVYTDVATLVLSSTRPTG